MGFDHLSGLVGTDLFEGTFVVEGVDCAVLICMRVRHDAVGQGCPRTNWAEVILTGGSVLCDASVFFTVFLILKGDGDAFCAG